MQSRSIYSVVIFMLLFSSSLYAVVQHQIQNRFHVIGVVGGAGDNQSVVLLKDQQRNKSFTLKVGQKLPYFAEAKIAKITSKEITIVHQNNQIALEVSSSGRSTVRESRSPIPNNVGKNPNPKDRNVKRQLDSAWEDLYDGVDWEYEDLGEEGKKEVSKVVSELVKNSGFDTTLSEELKEKINETKNMSDEQLNEYLDEIDAEILLLKE